jgi:molecular chaperone DnaJ
VGTPYDVLGVGRDASDDDILKAYRRLAKEHHPDRNPGDAEAEARFKEVTAAYEVIGDAGRRAEYDRFGAAPSRRSWSPSRPNFGPFHTVHDQFFGGSVERGRNVQTRLDITLEEAARGCVKTITVKKRDRCGTCHGQGGTSFEACGVCHGRGYQTITTSPFQLNVACNHCSTLGRVIKDRCPDCLGHGMTAGSEASIDIKIPPGLMSGMQVRVAGEGEVGRNGTPPGDLFVVVLVKEHPLFRVAGNDLVVDAWLGFTQLVYGCELNVPTITGESALVRVPPGTQPGTRFRLRGQGMPDPDGDRGDLFVTVRPEVPTELPPEYKAVLDRLADLETGHVTAERAGFARKVAERINNAS